MLRLTKSFRTSDFIQSNDYFGRVSERGLFDTEIQTKHRGLIALPNTYLIANPLKTVRASAPIVPTTRSLGYDEHHVKIEKLLIAAATSVGLAKPFEIVIVLENFGISYRVAGLLTKVKSLITTRSNLNGEILDTLHGAGVKIAPPTIMNQRRLPEDQPVVPPACTPRPCPFGPVPGRFGGDDCIRPSRRDRTDAHRNQCRNRRT